MSKKNCLHFRSLLKNYLLKTFFIESISTYLCFMYYCHELTTELECNNTWYKKLGHLEEYVIKNCQSTQQQANVSRRYQPRQNVCQINLDSCWLPKVSLDGNYRLYIILVLYKCFPNSIRLISYWLTPNLNVNWYNLL